MKSIRSYLLLFFKGIAMGSADVVPGVSGGTVAFITGIYDELLGSIKSVNGQAIKLLFSGKFKELWEYINGTFLIVLFAGIGTAIVSLARVITYLLDNEPVLLRSFFFGLIIASALIVGKNITKWSLAVIVSRLVGIAIAYIITVATPAQTPEAYWFIFLSGMPAICAMIYRVFRVALSYCYWLSTSLLLRLSKG